MTYFAELQIEAKYLFFCYWTKKKNSPQNYYLRKNNLTNRSKLKCNQAFKIFIVVKTHNIKFAILAILSM